MSCAEDNINMTGDGLNSRMSGCFIWLTARTWAPRIQDGRITEIPGMCLPKAQTRPRGMPAGFGEGGEKERKEGEGRRRGGDVSNASLFCGTLEPTRMRWECGQVRVTRLRKGSNCAGVQRCQVCAPINTPPQLELSLRSS